MIHLGKRPRLARPPYEAFSRQYDRFQGRLSRRTWDKGILTEIRGLSRRTGRVFDAGAGTGIGARKLKTFGRFYVMSCDKSRAMLQRAAGTSDATLLADLASLPHVAVKFDLIVSGADALNYLNRPELGSFFAWCSRHMTNRGLLLFDYSSPKLLRELWSSRHHVDRSGEWELRWDHRFDLRLQRATISLTCLYQKKRVWYERHYQYALDTYDIHRAAVVSGLEIRRVRNLMSKEFSPTATTHVYVLSRRPT